MCSILKEISSRDESNNKTIAGNIVDFIINSNAFFGVMRLNWESSDN